MQRPRTEDLGMSKLIAADVLRRNPEAGSTRLSFSGQPSSNGTWRILVVDNDRNTTRLLKSFSKREVSILYCRKTIRPRRIKLRAIFGLT